MEKSFHFHIENIKHPYRKTIVSIQIKNKFFLKLKAYPFEPETLIINLQQFIESECNIHYKDIDDLAIQEINYPELQEFHANTSVFLKELIKEYLKKRTK